jgi:hypothetical protein
VEVLEVSVVEEAVVLMVMGIKVLEEQAVNLTALQRLLVEKLPVDRVDRIQEVAEEVLVITKVLEVEDRGLYIFVTLQIMPQLVLNMSSQPEGAVVDQVPQAQTMAVVVVQEVIVLLLLENPLVDSVQ